MVIVPFRAEHVDLLEEQEHSRHWGLTADAVRALEGPYAYTGMVDGRPVVCAGVQSLWTGRGHAWAYLSWDSGTHFLAITRSVGRFLRTAPFVRIECAVACDFEPGHRWARLLGFKMEAERMERYGPDNEDYALYARVRGR